MTNVEVLKKALDANEQLKDAMWEVRNDLTRTITECIQRTQAGDKEAYKLLSFNNTQPLIDRLCESILSHDKSIRALADIVYAEED